MRQLFAIALVACSSPRSEVESAALACGIGTHEESGSCVADPVTYTIRANAKIVADGTTKTNVVVFGRHANGTPATDKIVLNTDRPNAGTFAPPVLDLGELHSVATFTPCDSTVAGCTGQLLITAALATAPTTPIAGFHVDLVGAPAIETLEPCLVGGNVLHVEGKRFIHRGSLTITNGNFARTGGTQRAEVIVTPSDPAQGAQWTLEFTSVQLGTPLAVGVYKNAHQVPPLGRPGMKVFGEHPAKTCGGSYRGEFQIHDFVYTTSVQRLTATFREWCDSVSTANPENLVTGCIHIE
jgi:hypothetical protein